MFTYVKFTMPFIYYILRVLNISDSWKPDIFKKCVYMSIVNDMISIKRNIVSIYLFLLLPELIIGELFNISESCQSNITYTLSYTF